MSTQVIIWLVVMAVIFLSRLGKKNPAKPSRPDNGESHSENRPLTFEELLREIEGAKTERQPKMEAETWKDVNYDDEDRRQEVKPLEDTNYDYRKHDEIYETYEKARLAAFNRPSLEETSHVSETIVKFGQFKGYEMENVPNSASDYAAKLRNVDSLKDALILSEILKPKF